MRVPSEFDKQGANLMAPMPAGSKTQEITLAHTPDSDDAFMFYALARHKVRAPGLKFTHVLRDIETLNQAAHQERFDVTAVSFYAYAFVREKYLLLNCGGSFGEGYGPIVVASNPLKPSELAGRRVAVPGLLTTAYLLLKLFEPRVEAVPMAFDKILEAVRSSPAARGVDAGLLIHEGQLVYSRMSLHRVADLGQWWFEQTRLPLPLGANAIRRALGPRVSQQVARAIKQSIAYGLEHRDAALHYALQFAREMDAELADKFIGMYVNRWTLDCGEAGRRAVAELFTRASEAGLISTPAEAEFLSDASAPETSGRDLSRVRAEDRP
jgi:1,4-dihydroxy-6-naphthoate synthase